MEPSQHTAFLQLSMMINKVPFVREAAGVNNTRLHRPTYCRRLKGEAEARFLFLCVYCFAPCRESRETWKKEAPLKRLNACECMRVSGVKLGGGGDEEVGGGG